MRVLGPVLRGLLLVLGVLIALAGGLWTLQGLGIVMWPAESFMLADRQWAINGAITALVGLGLIWLSRRLRRGRR
jgi:membrane protein implicated in regulation of membrane protease activity